MSGDTGLDADSLEQRLAEAQIRAHIERQVATQLPAGAALGMQFDGLSDDPPVLLEIWAHQGSPKPAQKNKVMTDALKLVDGDRELFGSKGRKVLAMADADAAEPFRRGTWMASALIAFGVEVVVVSLSPEVKRRLVAAQRRQAQGNR